MRQEERAEVVVKAQKHYGRQTVYTASSPGVEVGLNRAHCADTLEVGGVVFWKMRRGRESSWRPCNSLGERYLEARAGGKTDSSDGIQNSPFRKRWVGE